MKNNKSYILVTGAAGFIGYHLCKLLCDQGFAVVGLDNLNGYYDVGLKYARLNELGIRDAAQIEYHDTATSEVYADDFLFIRLNLEDKEHLPQLFKKFTFSQVCNLAAQAGVRYSLENPMTYVESNIVGFVNLLECVRSANIKRVIYASSSSVYGLNKKTPFSVDDNVDEPISLYAATKKSNELIAHTYAHLFGIKTIGLRFFTVYGPWGRPDMAMFLFTKAIIEGKPLKVFNHGRLSRDFTYIDDIVSGIFNVIEANTKPENLYSLYNIGKGEPVNLLNFIEILEEKLGLSAKRNLMEMQPGDVEKTWADTKSLQDEFGYSPTTGIKEGISKFVDWYLEYYKINI